MAKTPGQGAAPPPPLPAQGGPDSSFTIPPVMDSGLTFKELGSTGLRQYSGWIREEFDPNLQGRQAARVYREMLDNSPDVGGAMLAITGAMRKVPWRVEPAEDSPNAQEGADFAESLMHDMNVPWDEFIVEALSMLGYGFAPHEVVYKKRQGQDVPEGKPRSKYDDGKIGLRKLALRGQDTILKWFLGPNGEIKGLTQQPYQGTIIDIPVEKLVIFRPSEIIVDVCRAQNRAAFGVVLVRCSVVGTLMTGRPEKRSKSTASCSSICS